MDEFDIISHFFACQSVNRRDVKQGIGDDAAIVCVPDGQALAITTDTLVAGVHFYEDTSPQGLGAKALAVNLSDLAAMGAAPAWATLVLVLPRVDEAWLKAFCHGFFFLARRYGLQLIGGDLARGPLSITVQAFGHVPAGQAILRSGAQPGDLIFVTGTLGDAGLALRAIQRKVKLSREDEIQVRERLEQPVPRIEVGAQLQGTASAAIDVSDGLAADLGHILSASRAGALLDAGRLPLSTAMTNAVSRSEAIALALTAGDDYELCFTVPPQKKEELEKKLSVVPCRYTCIGKMTAGPGLDIVDQQGGKYHGPIQGHKHF